MGHPLSAINIVPYSDQVCCLYRSLLRTRDRLLQVIAPNMLDIWDYCLRKLFVLKSTPLKKAITYAYAIRHAFLRSYRPIQFKLNLVIRV